jgi:hypothetical protein
MRNTLLERNIDVDATTLGGGVFYPYDMSEKAGEGKVCYTASSQYAGKNYWEKYNEDFLSDRYYFLEIKNIKDTQKIEIIQEFVSKIINNSKDLDPSFAKIINEDFWKLI